MVRRMLATGAAVGALLLGAGVAAPGAGAGTRPITEISHGCGGQNAEVEQATWHRDVYEAWIGCNGIGFARSWDGGYSWSKPVTMAGSANAWDPAVAVSPGGVLYVSFMNADKTYAYPVVVTSFNSGRSFTRPAILKPPDKNNWGDRDFIAAGAHGVVYLTWDYGPSAALVHDVCSPSGSCGFSTGDLNVVIQKSTDYGRTWSRMVHVSPGFPASGGDSAPLLVEPDGRIDMSYQGYDIYNHTTYAMKPAHTYFTSSADGGRTWSAPVRLGASAGTMSLSEWWIDGAIGRDTAGNLYITWDTQGTKTDVGWLVYSTNHGRTWTGAIRVTPDNDNATHIVQVAGGAGGIAYVGWLADNSPHGYAQYLRTFSIGHGWQSGPRLISRQYGNSGIWPGDTFGISTWAGNPGALVLSWGSAVGGSKNSEIFATPVSG